MFAQSIASRCDKMQKKSTIHDIARELNVTASTVSRALHGNTRISEEMRRTVKDMAQQLGYEPNHIASALRNGRTRIIGVIVPTANRSFFSNVVRGVEAVAKAAEYSVIICQSNDDPVEEANLVDTLLRMRVDGILVSIARETRQFDHFKKVREQRVPLVLFDRVNELLGSSTVVLDDRLGAYMTTEHLVQQGFKCIACFAGPQHVNIYAYRYKGYCEALEAAGIPLDEKLVKTGNLTVEDGRRYMTALLELPNRPDAVFSTSDYAAVGAMQVLKEQGISIPGQMGLAGFANELFTGFVEPDLTSIDQHSEQMGIAAAQLIFEEMNTKDKKFIAKKIVLTPSLIKRSSSTVQ
jgi:LacI family transcriptional regulator